MQISSPASIPLSLYIHMPWCVRKCPYCDFNSHALKAPLPEQAYIDALLADFISAKSLIQDRNIHSIFIGGGTPSLFSASAIAYLLTQLQQHVNFVDAIEITLEANPGTVEHDQFVAYRQAGVNRLSIGVQSFQADKLKTLGRIHSADEAMQAIATIPAAGFNTFNIDLMHGLPQQSLADANYDLTTALSLSPTHLSWYQLTLEPNTLFYRKPPQLPAEETLLAIQQHGHELLSQAGWQHYEVSAYCQTDHQCQHNLNYWQFGDYLGIGAGAHSKITDLQTYQVQRYWQHKHPKDYLDPAKTFIQGSKVVSDQALVFEFMLNALRLQQSISLALFTTRTGLPVAMLEPTLMRAQAEGFLHFDDQTIQLTNLGRRFLNDVVELFL